MNYFRVMNGILSKWGLILVFLCFKLGYSQPPNYVKKDSLVAWWPLNGSTNDESGNSHNGSGSNLTAAKDRFGESNSAYFFNGKNSVISITDHTKLRIDKGDFTISLWYKISSFALPNRTFIVKSNGSGGADKWLIQKTAVINGGPNTAFHLNGSTNYYLNGNTKEDTLWHHVVVVKNNKYLHLYEDNILLNTDSNIIIPTSTAALRIGGDEIDFGDHYHHGFLDEIGIWNRALTSIEINALYKSCGLTITQQPNDFKTTSNNAMFITKVDDSSAKLQWQINSGIGWKNLTNSAMYSGVNTDTLKISNISISNDNEYYRCIIEGICFKDTTRVAVLKICNGIIKQPEDISVANGNVQFNVELLDTLVKYQWQTNLGTGWVNLENAGQYSDVNTKTLKIKNATSLNDGQLFRCIIEGNCGYDTTREVKLFVWELSNIYLSANKITLYPNPVNTVLIIEGIDISEPLNYEIISPKGEKIQTDRLNNKIDVSKISQGIYFLKLKNKTIKFEKE